MIELRYYKFPDASRNYTLLLRGGRMGIKLVDYGLFGRLHVVGRRWQVKQTLTGRRLCLPKSLWIGCRKLKQLRSILREGPAYVILPLIAHSHDYDYVVPDAPAYHISTAAEEGQDMSDVNSDDRVGDTVL